MKRIIQFVILLLISFNLYASTTCGDIVFKDYQPGGYMGRGTIYSVWISTENEKPQKFDVYRDLYESVNIGDKKCLVTERPSLLGMLFACIIVAIFVLAIIVMLNLLIT